MKSIVLVLLVAVICASYVMCSDSEFPPALRNMNLQNMKKLRQALLSFADAVEDEEESDLTPEQYRFIRRYSDESDLITSINFMKKLSNVGKSFKAMFKVEADVPVMFNGKKNNLQMKMMKALKFLADAVEDSEESDLTPEQYRFIRRYSD